MHNRRYLYTLKFFTNKYLQNVSVNIIPLNKVQWTQLHCLLSKEIGVHATWLSMSSWAGRYWSEMQTQSPWWLWRSWTDSKIRWENLFTTNSPNLFLDLWKNARKSSVCSLPQVIHSIQQKNMLLSRVAKSELIGLNSLHYAIDFYGMFS